MDACMHMHMHTHPCIRAHIPHIHTQNTERRRLPRAQARELDATTVATKLSNGCKPVQLGIIWVGGNVRCLARLRGEAERATTQLQVLPTPLPHEHSGTVAGFRIDYKTHSHKTFPVIHDNSISDYFFWLFIVRTWDLGWGCGFNQFNI